MGTGSIVCLQLNFSGVREPSLVLGGHGRCGLCKSLQCPAGALGSLAPRAAALGSLEPWAAPTARAWQGTARAAEGMGRNGRAADVAHGLL